jgi:hypothetical protein
MDIPITSPILLLVFNRPEKTQRVFDVIRSVEPAKLYVAADGPRDNVLSDFDKCVRVREIVSQINWKCKAKFLFHEKNLGCSLAGKKAWDWFFKQEEEMIFMEDDGLVSRSFFWFCQEMLKKYRNDPRIGYISGENFGQKYGNSSYFFSRMGGGTYSSATWKRVYELYEYKIDTYFQIKHKREFRKTFVHFFEYQYKTADFDSYVRNGGNTYDLQMVFLLHKYNMYNIIPNINMCSNIGYDFDGANTGVDPLSKLALKYGNLPRFEISEIVHPKEFEINKKFEKEYFRFRVLQGESYISAIYRFYDVRYGYHAWKQVLRKILVFFKILKAV